MIIFNGLNLKALFENKRFMQWERSKLHIFKNGMKKK